MNRPRVASCLVLVLALASVSTAAIITSADRFWGQSGSTFQGNLPFTGDTDPLIGTFAVGNLVYSDRDAAWQMIPTQFAGAEQVLTFNNDSATTAIFVRYRLTISEAATIGLTVDDRIPSEWIVAPSQQAAVDLVVQTWAAPGTFTDSGLKAVVDDGGILRQMSIYTAQLQPGTYDFGLQPSGLNFYSVFAVPEPATLLLLGLGGLLLRKRR